MDREAKLRLVAETAREVLGVSLFVLITGLIKNRRGAENGRIQSEARMVRRFVLMVCYALSFIDQ